MEDIVKKPKLLISFVLDNSAQMKGESLGEIMTSFRAFAERTAEREDLCRSMSWLWLSMAVISRTCCVSIVSMEPSRSTW